MKTYEAKMCFPPLSACNIRWSGITLSGWDVLGASEHFVLKAVLEAGKMEA